MKIVIIGAGKIGMALAETLFREGHEIALVDKDPKRVENAMNDFDVMGIVGNGVNYSVQTEAGVDHADVMIATTDSDEINMLCCLVAKRIGVRRTVARVRDPEYSGDLIHVLDRMGLDMVVNPEHEAAEEMFRVIRYPAAIGLNTFAKGKVDLAELRVPKESPLDGVQISQMHKRLGARILVCAIINEEGVQIPNGSSVIRGGDRIFFTASHDQLSLFFREMGVWQIRPKSVFIVGGGRIGYYLARRLLDLGLQVKVVENDPRRAMELRELLPKAQLILGDGTDQTLLEEENFRGADALVAATGRDEDNIILGMFAMLKGVRKVITKISKNELMQMGETVGLESIVAPKTLTENLILRYVRAMKNSRDGVQTMYRLADNQVEALEFHATDDFRGVNVPLMQLQLKDDLLICCIIRNSRIIIPGGNDVIRAGDHVIVTTRNQAPLSVLDDILR